MAVTREVPRSGWGDFADTFSERNQGRPVRIELDLPGGELPRALQVIIEFGS